jgi:hypothetical protein
MEDLKSGQNVHGEGFNFGTKCCKGRDLIKS